MPNYPDPNSYQASYRGVVNQEQKINVLTNKTSISVELSVDFDNESAKTTALDYFASSILSDMLLTIIQYMGKRGIEIDDLEGKIDVTLAEPLALLLVNGYSDPPEISALAVTIYGYLEVETAEEFQQVMFQALHHSVFYNTLTKAGLLTVIVKKVL